MNKFVLVAPNMIFLQIISLYKLHFHVYYEEIYFSEENNQNNCVNTYKLKSCDAYKINLVM